MTDKTTQNQLTAETLERGGKYNWQGQPERLVYMGREHYRGNGFWHQFAKTDSPTVVWCEVREADLEMFEVTK